MQGVLGSVAPTTLKSYAAAVERFWGFTWGAGAGALRPPSQEEVLRYLAHLRAMGRAPRSMRHDLAAVSFFCKALGFPDPCCGFIPRRAIEGWARLAPPLPDRRRPISLSILRRILRVLPDLCWSSFEVQLFRTAFSLAFFGALRVSELVAGSRADTNGRALSFTDVAWSPRQVLITIRHSKTDQRGKGAAICLRASRQGPVCPVRAVGAYLRVRPSRQGPFLIHGDLSPLTRYQFASLLRACLGSAGFPPSEFGTHSFRIGAATEAANLGLPDKAIMAVGRWRSRAFRSYIRPQWATGH
ncbi:integrase/recombinase xerD homolog [Eublepharis macularius]|uniref:Integrase/recombinase xerD homolog n=1 Tax=Eublepharis macularius TaxID=481883 RepID=A0AA97LHZ2_EUBMA|nr:integrase/recombinase xerD homolog [Eublepharis macularius]XP_054856096.1 integrase/recombinase xerD homolog [Eublepharis macularius]